MGTATDRPNRKAEAIQGTPNHDSNRNGQVTSVNSVLTVPNLEGDRLDDNPVF